MNAPAFTRRQFHRRPWRARRRLSRSIPILPWVRIRPAARQPAEQSQARRLDSASIADGSATIFTGKVELGQGILTALAQIAAEEIDLPLARIRMISGDTRQTPNEGQTAGSQSVENSGTALRMACAEARAS